MFKYLHQPPLYTHFQMDFTFFYLIRQLFVSFNNVNEIYY